MSGIYKWVRHNDEKLYSVGILADGTLHNPNGYPPAVVRKAILAADERRRERRSKAAKKAAVTRARRQERRTYQIAQRLLAGQKIGPQLRCACCRKQLTDRQSIERGIGSECWQGLLTVLEAAKLEAATASRKDHASRANRGG